MTAASAGLSEAEVERLRFLCRVVQREAAYLQDTDGQLFTELAAHASTGMLVQTAGCVVGAARRRLGE